MKINNLSQDNNKRFELILSAEEVEAESTLILDKIRTTTAIGGRPKGEASPELVARLFGVQGRATATENIVNREISQLVSTLGLSANAAPKIEEEFRPSATKRYTGIFADNEYRVVVSWIAEPAPELKSYLGIEISVPSGSREKAVDSQLKILQARASTNSKVERAAIESDTLMVDIVFRDKEGNQVKGGKFDGFVYSPRFKDTKYFGEPLNTLCIGLSAGESFSYEHTFPNNHPDQYVRGQSGQLDVKVLEVNEAVIPTIDDAFAVVVGHADLAALREHIGKLWDENERKKTKDFVKKAFHQKLLAENQIPVSDSEVAQVMKSYINDLKITKEILDAPELAEFKKTLESDAEDQVRLNQIFKYVRDLHPQECALTRDDLLKFAAEDSSNGRSTTPEQELAGLEGNIHFNSWVRRCQIRHTEAWLLSQAKVSFEETAEAPADEV